MGWIHFHPFFIVDLIWDHDNVLENFTFFYGFEGDEFILCGHELSRLLKKDLNVGVFLDLLCYTHPTENT